MVWIEAPSKGMLSLRTAKTIELNGKAYNFFPPEQEGDNWVTWYYADIMRDVDYKGDPLILLLEGLDE